MVEQEVKKTSKKTAGDFLSDKEVVMLDIANAAKLDRDSWHEPSRVAAEDYCRLMTRKHPGKTWKFTKYNGHRDYELHGKKLRNIVFCYDHSYNKGKKLVTEKLTKRITVVR